MKDIKNFINESSVSELKLHDEEIKLIYAALDYAKLYGKEIFCNSLKDFGIDIKLFDKLYDSFENNVDSSNARESGKINFTLRKLIEKTNK